MSETTTPTSTRTAVKVEDLSVTYVTAMQSRPTLKGTLEQLRKGEQRKRRIHAVKSMSFEVPHGEVLGIVGANGAGKSTLMRVIGGILPPTEGRVTVHGRVSTLLALGVGFNRKISGRENVLLGGLAAGYTRAQMKDKYEEIVAFSELGEAIEQPMREYSSGMFGRLAFSVAVSMDPDVLLIDEALSVGDAKFRKKSARKMRELCQEDRTVLLVSHALGSIQELSDTAIWIDKGVLKMQGDPTDVVAEYTKFLEVDQDAVSMEDI